MNKEQLFNEWGYLKDRYSLHNWELIISRGKNIAGSCQYNTKTIKISKYHLLKSSDEQIINTLKHEIAHALTPNDKGHGREWVNMCLAIGAEPKRCHNYTLSQHSYYVACVNGCFSPFGVHRKGARMKRSICRTCKNKIIFTKEVQ